MYKQPVSSEKTPTKQPVKFQSNSESVAEILSIQLPIERVGDVQLPLIQRQLQVHTVGEIWGNRFTQNITTKTKQPDQASHFAEYPTIIQRARTAQDIETNVLDLTGGGKDERSIRRIQQRLIDIGILVDKKAPDGQLDQSTIHAIQEFQDKNQGELSKIQADIDKIETLSVPYKQKNEQKIKELSDTKENDSSKQKTLKELKKDKMLMENASNSAEKAKKITYGNVNPNDVTNQALANAWPRRFFGVLLANDQAGFAYIAEQIKDHGLPFDENLINIVGIRGFQGGDTHDNLRMYHRDNRYDDTFFILALDQNKKPMIREFRGTTDPGAIEKNKKEQPKNSLALGKDQQFLYEYRFSPSSKFGRPMLELRTGEGNTGGVVFDPNRSKLPDATNEKNRQPDDGFGIEPKADPKDLPDLEKLWLPEDALKNPAKYPRYDRIRVEPYNLDNDPNKNNEREKNTKSLKNMYRSRFIAIHSGGGWDNEKVGGDSVGCQVIHGDWYGSFIMTLDRSLNWKRAREGANVPTDPHKMRNYDKKYVTYTLLDGHDLTRPTSQSQQTSSIASTIRRKTLDSTAYTVTLNRQQDTGNGLSQNLIQPYPNSTSNSIQKGHEEHAPFNEVDSLTGNVPIAYEEGEVTRGSEGNTLTIHWPEKANSGVTIGYGYDMGSRRRNSIINHLTTAGIPKSNAALLADAAGKKGDSADQFVQKFSKSTWATITDKQRTALFNQIYPSYQSRARSLATSTTPVKSKKGGVNAAARGNQYIVPTEIYDALHPVIKEILTDITYPGQYSFGRHEQINPILNDYRLSTLEKLRAIRIYLNARTTHGIGRAARIQLRTALIDKAIVEIEKKMAVMINERRNQLMIFQPTEPEQKARLQSELQNLERAYGNTHPTVDGLAETYQEDLTALREQWTTIPESDREKRAQLGERIRILEKLYGATIHRKTEPDVQTHHVDCACQRCMSQSKTKVFGNHDEIQLRASTTTHQDDGVNKQSTVALVLRSMLGRESLLYRNQAMKNIIQTSRPAYIVSHTFMGIDIPVARGVHPKMREQLIAVEAHLRDQYASLPAAEKVKEENSTFEKYVGVKSIKGWRETTSQHGTGRAVDVNYDEHPYIATRTFINTRRGSRAKFAGEEREATGETRALRQPAVNVYDRAVQFMKSDPSGSDQADVGNRRVGESASDVYRRFRKTSDALRDYLSLAFQVDADHTVVNRVPIRNPGRASKEELLKAIPETERKNKESAVAAIQSFINNPAWQQAHPGNKQTAEDWYFQMLRDYETVRKPMQIGTPTPGPAKTRNPAQGFLHFPEHFVVAMMEIGKLRWGACEFGAKANGDVHHFDLKEPTHIE